MGIIQKLKDKCYVKFDVEQEMLDTFCEANKPIWEGKCPEHTSQYIWLGFFMVEKWVGWMEPKILYAKSLEERFHHKTVVMDWEYNEKLEQYFSSYGIEYVPVKALMFKNITGNLYGLIKAVQTYLTCKTGKDIVGLKYKKRQIGQYVYDTIIRTDKNLFTVDEVRNKKCFKKVWTSYWLLQTLDKLTKKYPPAIYTFDDIVYDEGMIIQLMHEKKARILKCGEYGLHVEIPANEKPQFWPDIYRDIIRTDIARMSEEEKQQYIEKGDQEISNRFKGLNGSLRDGASAFLNKLECTPDELKKIMGVDENKKTVVIFAHCLSENPHKCSEQLYEDSYSWLVDTLKMVREIKNINWVLKGHPVAAKKYGEDGIMEGIYEKYKADNVFWFPNEYNSSLIAGIADSIVTIYGTVGLEYTCLGIPVVHTGKAIYSDFGYTIRPKTLEEYKTQLENMDKLSPLTEEQKNMAKLVFVYYNKRRHQEFDDFDKKVYAMFNQCLDTLIRDQNYTKDNTEALEYFYQYMKENDIRGTKYYQLGQEV